MNKLLISNIRSEIIGFSSWIIALLFKLYDYNVFAIIIFVISFIYLIIEEFYQFNYVSKYKQMFIDRNGVFDKDLNNDSISKIKEYKINIKAQKICNIVNVPFIILVVYLFYYVFKDELYSNGVDDYNVYFVYLVIVVGSIIGLINNIRDIIPLKTIDYDLDNHNFDTIKDKPIKIKALYYYGSVGKRERLKIGYGLKIYFSNRIKVIALIEFPFIGYRNMKKLIKEVLLNQVYELKYLKSSKVVVKLDSKIIKALR